MQIDHTKNIIELTNVSFAYGDTPVLDRVNLNIHKGDYLGVIGPNGGGKTTLVRLMLKLLAPSRGVIKLFGEPIEDFRDWQKIGYVPQNVAQIDHNFPTTVYEVVAMGRYGKLGLFHKLSEKDHIYIKKSLDAVEMSDQKDRLIGDLSGGQRQRIFIARALASEPEVIFLDEPTVGVDQQTQESFYKLLKKLNQQLGLTLILVSHDIDVVAREATEMACVNKTVTYDDSPQDFIKKGGLKKAYGSGVTFVIHNH